LRKGGKHLGGGSRGRRRSGQDKNCRSELKPSRKKQIHDIYIGEITRNAQKKKNARREEISTGVTKVSKVVRK